MPRNDSREKSELRATTIERGVSPYAEGSCLIQVGNTKVICTASVEDRVPPFLKGQGKGWLTAEYAMLPRATHTRSSREIGKPSGRSVEIQRLIGRSLRSAVDLTLLTERTITLDCDVLQADGGTRTASITGAFVALYEAIAWMRKNDIISTMPITEWVAAVSVGVIDGEARLDLAYEEDCRAEVDMNVVMTASGKFIEVQGTAEGPAFERSRLDTLLDLAHHGIKELTTLQRTALKDLC